MTELPASLKNERIFMIGIKGTGMAALAEILVSGGAIVSGCDVPDVFYTDSILAKLGIRPVAGFGAEVLPADSSLVIHSAAYQDSSCPALARARSSGKPVMLYTEALGSLSRRFHSVGIAGVHGKTTTTALCGNVVRALGLPATVLAGSAVTSFGGSSTLCLGEKYLVAETCEYKRHFLAFKPRAIVLTSVESDHQDYYPTLDSIMEAFEEYVLTLPEGGALIYCADDPGATLVASRASAKRPDLVLIPYGDASPEGLSVKDYRVMGERAGFSVPAFGGEARFRLRIPGRHIALDCLAALAVGRYLLAVSAGLSGKMMDGFRIPADAVKALSSGLEAFAGSKRRAEIVGERDGVLVMDDYAHHPTALKLTIAGLREFFPDRRIVVDFMSHTYSRTRALLDDFASSFGDADVVVLHGIYASAREGTDQYLDGRILADKAREKSASRTGASGRGQEIGYFAELDEAKPWLKANLAKGDLFVTMGAGDNWKLGLWWLSEGTKK